MKAMISLLCGGCSPEHEISLLSAQNIAQALLKHDYPLQVIYLDRSGHWYLLAQPTLLIDAASSQALEPHLTTARRVSPALGAQPAAWLAMDEQQLLPAGVVIPMLHGAQGEDGALQGLCELMQVPYVGPDVAGCACSMDKHISKRLLQQAGLPVVPWRYVTAMDLASLDWAALEAEFSWPMFVKPAATGSSLGVTKVMHKDALMQALEHALRYGAGALIEPAIVGRELECAVCEAMGRATTPGEIITSAAYEFYDYQAKYEDAAAAKVVVPAQLESTLAEKLRALAWQAAQTVGCGFMARVDFFLTSAGEIYINEVNAIPGFTAISMFAKSWQAEGVSLLELLQQMIRAAQQRHLQRAAQHGEAVDAS